MVLGGPITTLEAGNVIVLGEILVDGSPPNLTCSTLGGIAPPAITSISPSTGSTLGGTEVTIQGSGFDSTMAVYFGSTPATRIDATDASIYGLCTAWAPPMAKTGPVDITAIRTYGVLSSSASAAAVFTYVYLPGVLSLNVSSNVLWTGQTFTGTITLNEPAASGGTTVTLSTLGEGEGGVAAAGVITAPASVSIPAGRTSATFPISVAASATTETVYFSTTGPDGATQSTSVGLHTGQIFLTSPGQLVSGETAVILIFVREPAPESGGIISLSTNHADAISIPAQVPLPGGNTSATFAVTALKVTKVVIGVTISASYGGNSSTSEPFSNDGGPGEASAGQTGGNGGPGSPGGTMLIQTGTLLPGNTINVTGGTGGTGGNGQQGGQGGMVVRAAVVKAGMAVPMVEQAATAEGGGDAGSGGGYGGDGRQPDHRLRDRCFQQSEHVRHKRRPWRTSGNPWPGGRGWPWRCTRHPGRLIRQRWPSGAQREHRREWQHRRGRFHRRQRLVFDHDHRQSRCFGLKHIILRVYEQKRGRS